MSNDILDIGVMVPLDDILGESCPAGEVGLERRQLITVLLRVLAPRQERVIRLHYGIGGASLSANDIADEFGLTRSRIDMLHKDALRRMARAAKRIDAAEPEMIADPAFPLPRGWALPDVVHSNRYFVQRLQEARCLPLEGPAPRKKAACKRKTRTSLPHPVSHTQARSPSRERTPAAQPVHRLTRTDKLILVGYPFVLPTGVGAIIAGAEFGGMVGLVAGVLVMPLLAGLYEGMVARSEMR